MTKQEDVLLESAVKSQHQTIMEGGKIEEFAEALGRFCRVQGWKKLKDEQGNQFQSLRHYIEAKPPFGAGYPGKEGMEKIEAYLSLQPAIKDYFQHCHANCIFELAEEKGVNPSVFSKKEWDDVKGARLAKMIQEAPEQAYQEKAMAYLESKDRVKPKPKEVDALSPVRLSYRPGFPCAFSQKLREHMSMQDIEHFIHAFSAENLNDLVEFERKFHIALNAFHKSKEPNGWGIGEIKAPKQLIGREPLIEHSCYVDTESEGKTLLSLRDISGEIVVVRLGRASVNALSFAKL